MNQHNVFVYGTLLSAASNPAERLVDAKVISRGTVPGFIYDLGWFPGYKPLSVLEEINHVQGELISVDQEGLERLDAYEGCPSLYRRADTTVLTEEGEYVPAQIYIYNGQVHPDDVVPHGDWISYSHDKEKENA